MPEDWPQLAEHLTLTTALLAAIFAFARGYIVPRGAYDEMKAQMQSAFNDLKDDRDRAITDLKQERDSAVVTMRESIHAFQQAMELMRQRPPGP